MLYKLNELIRKTDNLLLPHKGIVVINSDPKKLNRVKCIIKGILETDVYNNLPWCYPVVSNLSSSTVTNPPEIGSELWVEFPFGKDSIYQPIYRGYWYSEKNAISNENNSSQGIFGVDYPDIYGYQDSTGNYMLINKKQEVFDLEHSSGDHIKVEKNGKITITGNHDIVINNKGNLDIINQGKVKLESVNSEIEINSTIGDISITATSKVLVKGTLGVTVVGSLVKISSDTVVSETLMPKINGVVTGITPCILVGLPHKEGSSTVLCS